MADRWTDEREPLEWGDYGPRGDRSRGGSQGARDDGWRDDRERSFQPRSGLERQGRGPVFGERQSGADYSESRYADPRRLGARDSYGRGRDEGQDHWRFGYDPDPVAYPRDARESHRGRGPQGYRRTDARISEDVHDRLTEDHHVDASEVSVTVQDGEVTLSGRVESRRAKHHAEHIAEDVTGVRHVQNNLRVDEDLRRRRGAATNAQTPLGENSVLAEQAAGKA